MIKGFWRSSLLLIGIVHVFHVLFLLTPAQALTPTRTAASRNNVQVASEILVGLRQSTATTRPLELTTDFFDPSTGLHSEGVWHNCLLGITGIRLFQELAHDEKEAHVDNEELMSLKAPIQMAESLFEFSWDGISFRRRAWSGNWDHSVLLSGDGSSIEQADYYRESSEHRCVQHGMALVFWSLLVQQCNSENKKSVQYLRKQQHQLIAAQFLKEFWDPLQKKWTTVSSTQGGGNRLRPSASGNKITMGTSEKDKNVPYFRAVDQAISILGCLEYLQVVKEETGSSDTAAQANAIEELITTTCQQLLSSTSDDNVGFGYEDASTAQSYIGLKRNRNFWHDGWVMLALIQAHEYIQWPKQQNPGDASSLVQQSATLKFLKSLWNGLLERYGHKDKDKPELKMDGTVWHWAPSERDDATNVRYCGDNVLCFAIRRSLAGLEETLNDKDKNKEGYLDAGFWKFIGSLRKDNPMDLSSVADVYPQVRLHPNSELAALLVWP